MAKIQTNPRNRLTNSILRKLKMQKRINFIEDLSQSDLDLLAQLLHFSPTTNDTAPFPPDPWLASQATTLSSFPLHLLRPTSFLPKLAMKMPFTAPKAVLCSTHKPLNPFLIRRVFLQLCAETGLRVRGLVSASAVNASEALAKSSDKPSDKTSSDKEFNPEVCTWLHRLRTLNSLWMSPDLYRTFSRAMPDDERFKRVESGCEACILTVVGGNLQAILDLRSSLVGRKKSGYESRLWGLVDAWTQRSGGAAQIRGESERVGRLVLKERRRARRRRRSERSERRLERKNDGGRIETGTETAAIGSGDGADDGDAEPEDAIGDVAPKDNQGGREAEEHDFEGSIINFYRGVASQSNLTVNVPPNQHSNHSAVSEDVLHPAFRDSVAYSTTSGTFRQRPQQPLTMNRVGDRAGAASRFTFYTQSAYSQDGGLDSGFGGSSSAQSHSQALETLPSRTYNPFVKASSTRAARDKNMAERRAESYRKLVGIPEEVPVPRSPPSDAVREYMLALGIPIPGAGAEKDGAAAADDDASNERAEKALTDAYYRSRADEGTREKHLTTWSEMMKGGAKKWLGS